MLNLDPASWDALRLSLLVSSTATICAIPATRTLGGMAAGTWPVSRQSGP